VNGQHDRGTQGPPGGTDGTGGTGNADRADGTGSADRADGAGNSGSLGSAGDFSALMDRFRSLGEDEVRGLRERAVESVFGHDAYALAQEYLAIGDHDHAERWLRVAAERQVLGAQRDLEELVAHRALDLALMTRANAVRRAKPDAGVGTGRRTLGELPDPLRDATARGGDDERQWVAVLDSVRAGRTAARADREAARVREQARQEADEMVAGARRQAEAILERARAEAAMIAQEARRRAEATARPADVRVRLMQLTATEAVRPAGGEPARLAGEECSPETLLRLRGDAASALHKLCALLADRQGVLHQQMRQARGTHPRSARAEEGYEYFTRRIRELSQELDTVRGALLGRP
jgi:cell division septum initiation protein DivIVA